LSENGPDDVTATPSSLAIIS